MPRKKIIEEKNEATVTPKHEALTKAHFIYAVGKRKTANARVRLYAKSQTKDFIINNKKIEEYFPYFEQQKKAREPLKIAGLENNFLITVKVAGGGKHGQADAVRHGVARALLKYNEDLRKVFKPRGFLTRDSRMKERKKPGLKRARRAPQWQKR